jgi:DNA processing protein
MLAEDEAAAWVALRATVGIGDVTGRRLVESFGGPAAALAASREALLSARFSPAVAAALAGADLAASAAEVRRTHAAGARLIPCTDTEYPALLRQVPDAPLYLVARGEPIADGPTVAVVGARHATPYGREVATRLAEELAQAGVTVVSGLARGIDGAAHAGALHGGGQTIAVLGSGIDVVYPREHAELAERIAQTGTLLSERPLGAPPLAEHFPARNRIIAGMTHGTVVVEAAARSGSLITARLALEQGREVFAVPGRIDSPLSVGTHRLIQEGAKLTASLDDILIEIAPALRARAGAAIAERRRGVEGGIAGAAEEPLLPLLAGGPLAIDELIRESGLPASQVLTRVLELELRGILLQLPGKQFQLARH